MPDLQRMLDDDDADDAHNRFARAPNRLAIVALSSGLPLLHTRWKGRDGMSLRCGTCGHPKGWHKKKLGGGCDPTMIDTWSNEPTHCDCAGHVPLSEKAIVNTQRPEKVQCVVVAGAWIDDYHFEMTKIENPPGECSRGNVRPCQARQSSLTE